MLLIAAERIKGTIDLSEIIKILLHWSGTFFPFPSITARINHITASVALNFYEFIF